MKLSERLVELRKKKGLSQMELAEALNVSRQSVSLWENGSTTPTVDRLQFLAEFYGITIDELFYPIEENPGTDAPEYPPQATKGRYRFWLCVAIMVILAVSVLITTVERRQDQDQVTPTSIEDIEGIAIDPDEIIEIEFDRD